MTPELFSLAHNIEIPAVGKWHRITFCDYYGYDAPEIGDVLFVISAEILGDHSVLLHTIWNEQTCSFITIFCIPPCFELTSQRLHGLEEPQPSTTSQPSRER